MGWAPPLCLSWWNGQRKGERGGVRRWTVWVKRRTDGEGQNAVKEAGGGCSWRAGRVDWTVVAALASGRNG